MAARSQQTKVLLEKHTNNQSKNLVFQDIAKPGMSTDYVLCTTIWYKRWKTTKARW
jgi:hypothetical protein